MLELLASLTLAACQPPTQTEKVLLVLSSTDEALLLRKAEVDAVLRAAGKGRLDFVAPDVAARALSAEGGAEKREESLDKGRVLVRRAEKRFRELDAEVALDLLAKATASVAPVHQEEGAIPLLAKAHLLAGAIYLAQERVDAARKRLQRALDLDPEIRPERHVYAPRVLSELAALRSAQNVRPVGRLEVRLLNEDVAGRVFIDGQSRGTTPLTLDAIGEGRHLLRVSAPGYRSYASSFSIEQARGHVENVNLVRDQEVSQIVALPRILRRGEDPTKTLSLLARRAGAERAILAILRLSEARTTTGAPAVGSDIVVPGAGRAYAPSPAAAGEALARALECREDGPAAAETAPYLLGEASVGVSRPSPVPEPDPFYERPWFWGVAAFVALFAAGGVVVARSAGGPPEAVDVVLVPRP